MTVAALVGVESSALGCGAEGDETEVGVDQGHEGNESSTPELMRHHYQFMDRLHHAIGLQRAVLAKAALQVEAANQVLLQAEFRLAALKQVLATKKAEVSARKAKREQKQMDEFAALQFARVVRSGN